jgi:ATP-dependent RNA helicase DDX51/DBP6
MFICQPGKQSRLFDVGRPLGDMTDDSHWTDFHFIPDFLLTNLTNSGFQFPFPVQSAVLSHFFSSDTDLAIGFPTGSGKTLAYLIPVISSLHSRIVPRLRAVIVVPNRALASQVFSVASNLISGSDLSVSVLKTGQSSGPKRSQPDILIATSQSLLSYVIDVDVTLLCHVQIIVLDEGDAILEKPIENWLDHVQRSLESGVVKEKLTVPIAAVPPAGRRIRKVLCSATLSRNAKQSEDFGMVAPMVLVASDRSRYVVPAGMVEEFIVVAPEEKVAVLIELTKRFRFVLCFVSTAKRCFAVSNAVKNLSGEISVTEFAGTLVGNQRQKALEEVVEGQRRLVVATDTLARGMDLPFIEAVVNFDVPLSSRTYVHRMGRTARGGSTGRCVTFVLANELTAYRDVIAKVDGSSPQEAFIDVKKYVTPEYAEMTRKLVKLKVRTRKRNVHASIPDGVSGLPESDEEEEEQPERQ